MTDNVNDIVDYGESGLESHRPNDHSVPETLEEDARDSATANDTSGSIPDAHMADATQSFCAMLESTRPSAATNSVAVSNVILPGSVQIGTLNGRADGFGPPTKQDLDSGDAPGIASSNSVKESNAVPVSAVSTSGQTTRARSKNFGFENPASSTEPRDAPQLI